MPEKCQAQKNRTYIFCNHRNIENKHRYIFPQKNWYGNSDLKFFPRHKAGMSSVRWEGTGIVLIFCTSFHVQQQRQRWTYSCKCFSVKTWRLPIPFLSLPGRLVIPPRNYLAVLSIYIPVRSVAVPTHPPGAEKGPKANVILLYKYIYKDICIYKYIYIYKHIYFYKCVHLFYYFATFPRDTSTEIFLSLENCFFNYWDIF